MSETERCPICQNTVSAVVENGDETIYKHPNLEQGNCIDHGDGRVSMTWDKEILLSIMREAEIGSHYKMAARRGIIDPIIDDGDLREAWDGENTDVLPMTKYEMNGYDARMTKDDLGK